VLAGIVACVWSCALAVHPALSAPPTPATSCPKILFFDGVSPSKSLNETEAKYWGETVGIDGFFLGDIMYTWEDSVGDDENGRAYQLVRQFQQLYSKHGVTDNFLKVAIHYPHDWKTPAAQDHVVQDFHQGAHLARSTGLRGLALDLEPYVNGFWDTDPAVPDKAERAYMLGKRIGYAIWSEYPEAIVIVLPEVLNYKCPPFPQTTCEKYATSGRFWQGLVQAHFGSVLIATESTYDASSPPVAAAHVWDTYRPDVERNGIDVNTIRVAPGLWPLGKSYTDKSAHVSAAQFAERLRLTLQFAAQEGSPYIWIYGHGSAWEENGPWGNNHVDPQFNQFLNALHRVKQSCRQGIASESLQSPQRSLSLSGARPAQRRRPES